MAWVLAIILLALLLAIVSFVQLLYLESLRLRARERRRWNISRIICPIGWAWTRNAACSPGL
jgi:hypothetical protein